MPNKISNNPPKGTADWFPEEFAVRKYIFDSWRSVCTKFGYQEYLTPIIESAELYRAKSGEDVGGKELMTMTDRGGRELAIRPEMTPSVTRLVSRIYGESAKPIRYFSIANFLRNEKPQRGRNREFWQLNFDIFGTESSLSDIEILQMAIEIMLSFSPPKNSFVVHINNRKLIDFILNQIVEVSIENRSEVVRVMDKWEKLSLEEIENRLRTIGLNSSQIAKLQLFMQSENAKELLSKIPEVEKVEGFVEIQNTIESLNARGYADWILFKPNVIRGFDYYDGMVFEVFDKHPDNSRSMFGGGRYNGLAAIFGSNSFPAVGCAPGDETTRIFLESWNLIPKDLDAKLTYIPLLDSGLEEDIQKIASKLRVDGENVVVGLELQKIGKALETANKNGYAKVVIFGEIEKQNGEFKLKDMQSGEESVFGL